jgi:hypothetical protein
LFDSDDEIMMDVDAAVDVDLTLVQSDAGEDKEEEDDEEKEEQNDDVDKKEEDDDDDKSSEDEEEGEEEEEDEIVEVGMKRKRSVKQKTSGA